MVQTCSHRLLPVHHLTYPQASPHNDLQYHWFKDVYIEKWGMTDEIYDDILAIANICIDYCNGILKLFNQRLIYEYSNHDDVKHLFGLKTEWDEKKEILEQIL